MEEFLPAFFPQRREPKGFSSAYFTKFNSAVRDEVIARTELSLAGT